MATATFSNFGSLPQEAREQIWDVAVEATYITEMDWVVRDRIYLTSTLNNNLLPEDRDLYCQAGLVFTPAPSSRGRLWNTYAESRAAVTRARRRVEALYPAFRYAMECGAVPAAAGLLRAMHYVWVPDGCVAPCSRFYLPKFILYYSPFERFADLAADFVTQLSANRFRRYPWLRNSDITPVFFRREPGRTACYGLSTAPEPPAAFDPFDRVFWARAPKRPLPLLPGSGPCEFGQGYATAPVSI